MKKLEDLTKKELLTFIYNRGFNIFKELAECACCGKTPDAEYHYECEKCIEVNKDSDQ